MTLEDIKVKIGRRSSDPNATRYGDEIEDYFVDSMCELIGSDQVNYDEFPNLLEEVSKNYSFSRDIKEIVVKASDFPKVLKVLKPISGDIEFVKETEEKLTMRSKNPILRPAEDEGFWAKDHNVFRMLVNSSKTPATIKFKVIYNPDKDDWGNADLIDAFGYGRNFLYRCINMAAMKLRQQIGMEA